MKRLKGFSLMEIVVAVGVIAVVTAVVATVVISGEPDDQLGEHTPAIKRTLEQARELARTNKSCHAVTFSPEGTGVEVELLKAASADCSDIANGFVVVDTDEVEVDYVYVQSASGPPDNVIFLVTGRPAAGASAVNVKKASAQRTISISAAGLID